MNFLLLAIENGVPPIREELRNREQRSSWITESSLIRRSGVSIVRSLCRLLQGRIFTQCGECRVCPAFASSLPQLEYFRVIVWLTMEIYSSSHLLYRASRNSGAFAEAANQMYCRLAKQQRLRSTSPVMKPVKLARRPPRSAGHCLASGKRRWPLGELDDVLVRV